MKNLKKLLALALAAAMLLSVGAFAADNEDGPRLVMCWLDWNEKGQCYASDGVLDPNSGGSWDLHMDPTRHDHVIFFVQDGDKKTPVVPTGDGNVNAVKVDKEAIAPGAKESGSYVYLEMKTFKDGVFTTTYQGKKLTFEVRAMLPDVGLYSADTASIDTLLPDGSDPSQLKDKTAYIIINSTDEDNGRHVTAVKKHGSDPYELEKVSDDVYKIVITANDGGIGVNLDVSWLDAEGSAYDEERGWYFEYPQGPELWIRWADWIEDGYDIAPDAEAYRGFAPWPTSGGITLVFYKCDYDDKGNQTFTPVPADQLKADAGLTLMPVPEQGRPGSETAKCLVDVRATEWNKDFTISAGEYTMQVSSYLPDVGLYAKPELSTDVFMDPGRVNPGASDTWYIGFNPRDGRTVKSLELVPAGGDNNNEYFTLKEGPNGFYTISLNNYKYDQSVIRPQMTLTWEGEGSDTWTDDIWFDFWSSAMPAVSTQPFLSNDTEAVSYADVEDKLVNELTIAAGEETTVYLGMVALRGNPFRYVVRSTLPDMFTADDGLKITPTGPEAGQFTISASKAGTYQLSIGGYSWYVYDETGKEISEDLAMQDIAIGYDYETKEYQLYQYASDGSMTPAGLDYKITVEPMNDSIGTIPVTVTVTGEAAKPTETNKSFPDVKSTEWYAPAVSFASTNGYMSGNANGTFNPNGEIKGCEFAQILYNKEGKPAAAEGASFQGVTAEQWFAPAILWAAGKGIVTDTGETAIVPEANLTRQQIALMLYNYMGKPEGGADLGTFADADQVSSWAKDAMEWAVSAGVLKGNDNKGVLTLNPAGTAKRCETAQILMNFFG